LHDLIYLCASVAIVT